MVGFRDWLRTHDDDRLLYERKTVSSPRMSGSHVQNYADAKTEVVEGIIGKASRAPSPSTRSKVDLDTIYRQTI